MADLKLGWLVIGNDDGQVGVIRNVGQNYLLTSTAGLGRDLYIPASFIANVEDEIVYLSIAHHEAAEMGWEQPPRDDDSLSTSPEADLHRHI